MASYDMRFARAFFALSPQERLHRMIDTTFEDWRVNLNEGVSLVYDSACAMIQGVTEKIFGVDPLTPSSLDAGAGDVFDIVSSRLALPIETGHDQFNPDAGALTRPDAPDPCLFLFETAVRALSSEDARFEPRYLLPSDAAEREALGKHYGRVFSVQLRFWTQDLPDYEARYHALQEELADYPDVVKAEKVFRVPLRIPLRFRMKHKEPFDRVETAVTAIAIGRELMITP
ncbi:hypothetical protein [Beijerinckia indica]|uniref:Uncharacterized protein n=1 Tax=Beijerinckia indica subsp. indica (strain ATCC 9039 / DSM 1715 / NCIMB 8712) TaxID=395963 RepID=B2IGF0_BEII9|nr:hypothetical protein [Beijerinckia indica]ACB94332.1 hypothetical protein Bind_0682 [Beijerinckia indica subsp. indica ATCC 9039]